MLIRTKLIIVFFCLSFLSFYLIASLSYTKRKEAIEKKFGLSIQLRALEVIDSINRGVYEIYRDVKVWTNLDVMKEVVDDDRDGHISSFLKKVSKQYGSFLALSLANSSGEVVASSRLDQIGQNRVTAEIFQKTIAGKEYISDVYLHPEYLEWVITFSFPLYADFEKDRVIGVLSALWKAENLFSLTRVFQEYSDENQYNDTTYTLLMKDDGLIISAPSSRKKDIYHKNLLSDGYLSARLALQKEKGYLFEKGNGKERLLVGFYSTKDRYNGVNNAKWTVLVMQDADIAFKSIEHLKIVIFSMAAVASFFVIVIFFIVACKRKNPTLPIAQAANQIAQEMGQRTLSFSRMTEDLKKITVSKDYVDNILNTIVDCLIVISPDRIIKRVNNATLNLFGYKEEELLEKNISILFFSQGHPLTKVALAEHVDRGTFRDYEIECFSKMGRKIQALINGAILKGEGHESKRIVCVLKDITARKESEEKLKSAYKKLKEVQDQLLQSAKLSAIGELAGGLAHELNNPLVGILGYAQYTRERINSRIRNGCTKEDMKIWGKYLGNIVKESGRCRDIVQNLLNFARASKVEFVQVNINQVLDDTIVVIGHQLSMKKIQLKKIYSSSLPLILGDENQLQQVFTNLIINAQQAMRGGGEIIVLSRYLEDNEEDHNWIEVEIQDNGTGIKKEDLEKVFNPFFTTKEVGEGTGIGLSVSYGIIKDHHGKISCRSEEERGTSFIVKLPAASNS